MRIPRRSGRCAVPVAVFAAAVVAACQQPTPGVTMQSGGRVVRSGAAVVVRDGKQVRGTDRIKVLKAHPGAIVGIDVDGSVADSGWQVHITTGASTTNGTSGASTLDSAVLKGQHHFSFSVGSTTTQIVVSELGSGTTPQGLWLFSIAPTLP